MAKSALGKGLSALMGASALAAPEPAVERGESIRQFAPRANRAEPAATAESLPPRGTPTN